ncbi:hypothetical protein VTI28DRAFT_2072 [Corynascus sepedonium]
MKAGAIALGAFVAQAAADLGDHEKPPFSLGNPTVVLPTHTWLGPGHGWPYPHPPKWTTSTVYTTSTKTIPGCAPTKTDCPGHGVIVTTVTIPVSTTVCPVTETTETSPPPPPPTSTVPPPPPPPPPTETTSAPPHHSPSPKPPPPPPASSSSNSNSTSSVAPPPPPPVTSNKPTPSKTTTLTTLAPTTTRTTATGETTAPVTAGAAQVGRVRGSLAGLAVAAAAALL